MNTIQMIINLIDKFSIWTGKFFSWLVLLLMFLTCYEVITRRLFGSPTIWTLEISTYIFCGVCMLALGYTQQSGGHVNVDIFSSKFSPKLKAILNIVSFCCFVGLFSGVLFIYGCFFAYDSVIINERSPSAFNALVWPSKLVMPIGALMLFLQAFAGLLKDIVFLVKGEEL